MMTSVMDGPHAFGLHVANFEIPMSLITSLTRPCTFPASVVPVQESPKLWKSAVGHGILLPKLFWPTVRKKSTSDQEKFWDH